MGVLVINAFDDHIANLSRKGYFVDPATGNPVTSLADQINAASRAYAKHFDTYETMNGQNNPIVAAVRKLKTGQQRAPNGARMASGDTDLYTKAAGPLGRELLDPVKGADMYNSLMKATGNSPAVAAFVKSQLMDSVGKVKTPGNIAKLLADPNSSVAKSLTPAELTQARHIHAASVINNTKPTFTSRLSSIFRGNIGSAIAKSAATGLGYSTLGVPGAVLGILAEHGLESGADWLKTRASMRGAPTQPLKQGIKGIANPNVVVPIAAAAHYSQDPSIQPIARAAGGRVDESALVERLMKRFKAAKRATDATTKPLLALPDAAVIKALDLAQEHL